MAISVPSREQAVIPFEEWWPRLLDATHVIITGGKGSGKTTLTRALMLALAEQGVRFVLIDPHHRKGDWGPAIQPLAGGRRFEEARAAFAWGVAELDRRYKARADHGDDRFEPVAFVVDEFDLFSGKRPDVADDLRELASQFLAMIGDESRKVGMRLIVIAHGTEVRNLALEGRGSKRHNYTMVALKQGVDHRPEPAGTLRSGSTVWTIDTTPVLALAQGTLTPELVVSLPDEPVLDDPTADTGRLRRRIAELERALAAERDRPAAVVEVPIVTAEQLSRLESLLGGMTDVVRELARTLHRAREVNGQADRDRATPPSAKADGDQPDPAPRDDQLDRVNVAGAGPASLAAALATPAIVAKLNQARARVRDPRARSYVDSIFALLWQQALTPMEIAEARGVGQRTVERLRIVFRSLAEVRLLADAGDGRMTVDHTEVARLTHLAESVPARRRPAPRPRRATT